MEIKKSKYFKIQEFVPKKTYEELGETAWKLISPRWIDIMDSIQELFGDKKVVINNWDKPVIGYRDFQFRGIRTKDSKEYNPNSQHCKIPLECSDFNVVGLNAHQVACKIMENGVKLHAMGVRRTESAKDAPTWTHLDCKETGKKTIHIFNAK